jgi:hypothetical protein
LVNVVNYNQFNRTKIVSTGGNPAWNKNSQFSKPANQQFLGNKVNTGGTTLKNTNALNNLNNKTNSQTGQGPQKFNQQGIASINNQNGGTNKFRSNNTGNNGQIKTNTQKLTTSQSFKPATNFKPPTNFKPSTKPVVRAQHQNKKP